MKLTIIAEDGQEAQAVEIADTVFNRDYNEALVHQLLVAFQANARSGNRKQRDREEVHHSTKKPFKQKGTGRARAGMTSSPIWRGGGRTFPNSPDENFSQKLNRKMYRAGMAVILSQLNRENRIVIVNEFTIAEPKTRLVSQKLKSLGLDSVLIVTDAMTENLVLASRNLPRVTVLEPHQADPVSLLRHAKVAMTKGALAKFEEAFQ